MWTLRSHFIIFSKTICQAGIRYLDFYHSSCYTVLVTSSVSTKNVKRQHRHCEFHSLNFCMACLVDLYAVLLKNPLNVFYIYLLCSIWFRVQHLGNDVLFGSLLLVWWPRQQRFRWVKGTTACKKVIRLHLPKFMALWLEFNIAPRIRRKHITIISPQNMIDRCAK